VVHKIVSHISTQKSSHYWQQFDELLKIILPKCHIITFSTTTSVK